VDEGQLGTTRKLANRNARKEKKWAESSPGAALTANLLLSFRGRAKKKLLVRFRAGGRRVGVRETAGVLCERTSLKG